MNNGSPQLSQLYAQKGELITEIEVFQRRLQEVNQMIFQLKNAPPKPKAEKEE